MMRIICDLNDFSYDENIKKPKDELAKYSSFIRSNIKEKLNGIKVLLDNNIIYSAAFVALEDNLLEYVKNSLDAFRHSPTNDRRIIIKVPITPDKQQMTKIIYSDTAGGFPEDFFKEKKCIDYYSDVLLSNKMIVKSEKNTEKDLGGAGLGLSQTSRFLHEHAGTLKLDNTNLGARMHLTSPMHSSGNKKPSFKLFRRQDYQNLLVEEDLRRETATTFIEYEDNNNSQEISVLNPINPRAKKLGLSLLIIPENKTKPTPKSTVSGTTPWWFFSPASAKIAVSPKSTGKHSRRL